MRYSNFTQRIDGEGAAAWDIHNRAVEKSRQGEDIILLSMGDPDFDTPRPIIEAAIDSLRAGDTHYTDFTGEPELRQAIAQLHQHTTGQKVGIDNIVVLAGAQCALYCAAHCILDPGDEVIVPEPTYVTYEAVIGATGAKTVNVPMDPDNGFRINVADIEAAITDKTRAIMLNTPHNPTGAALSVADIEAIAALSIKHDLWVISDEVYASLVYDESHHSIAGIPGMADRAITLNSLSKSHAMTGWRLGWIVGPESLSYHLGNMVTAMLYGVPTFIQKAAVVAITGSDNEVEAMRIAYRDRRDLAYKHLNAVPNLRCHLPAGGMFMMIDIRKSGLSAQQFSNELLDRVGVSALAGEAFGPSAAGHIRISLGVPNEVLEQACQRIAACFTAIMDEQ
ncbi:pyridoxal phosphate-dependent aminotransferase [Dasania marina]|uniref:pyridoxal phosphate-dependent aminotransferase n=1 Tax=Dasania marina TaxID=471499 RepID=UPI000368CEE4|nr:pyridoxal phosphate-dependent aminotransferase [Dasania marina]|tara:strand:+ start:83357 stop:84538 length:1182 start_codon:yes stop_codon:yes gene_type:complete